MSASLFEWHERVVGVLKKRGEPILGGMKWDIEDAKDREGLPDVYVKGAVLGATEFVCGHAFPEKDGTISILHDMLAYQREGYTIDQLGLCNPRMWYTTRLLYIEALKKVKE